MSISNTLKNLVRDTSQYRTSKDTGIPQSSLSDWVNGHSALGSDKMDKLADYFGLELVPKKPRRKKRKR